jgi:hypothetical protein
MSNDKKKTIGKVDKEFAIGTWIYRGWYWDQETKEVIKEEDEIIHSCEHEWINVGFTHITLVCKKCNKDKV